MKNKVLKKMRERRNTREFARALDGASPRMRAELMTMAQHQHGDRHLAN